MAKVKYYYDPKTLSYRKIEKTPAYRLRRSLFYLTSILLTSVLLYMVADSFIDSPKEKRLRRELDNMKIQYSILKIRAQLWTVNRLGVTRHLQHCPIYLRKDWDLPVYHHPENQMLWSQY